MKIISGTSNPKLAQSIAQLLGLALIDCEISFFANREKRVWIKENVRGQSVILVQDLSKTDQQPITELLLLADALERSGARHVNLIMPWMAYSLQDKVFREGEPISAKVIANLVSNAYIKRAFLLDLHNSSTPGFFSIPTDHLSALPLFVDYIKKNFDQKNLVVASPDFGGLKRARTLANKLGTDLVNIDKERDLTTGEVNAIDIQGGSVKGKSVILYDDVIVSGGTIIEGAKLLKARGAKAVHFVATHGLLVAGAQKKLTTSDVDSIVITNSVAHEQLIDKIKVVDAAPLFAASLKDWM